MAKILQITGGICYWDATFVHPKLDSIMPDQYPPTIQFVEVPDYVREGWGYDETQEGDARFIEPKPPAGWLYDRATGTFNKDPNYVPPAAEPDPSEMEEALNLLGVTTRETDT